MTLVLLLAAGCAGDRGAAPPPAGPEPPLIVRRGTLEPRIALTGEVQAVAAEMIVVPRTPSMEMAIRWIEVDGAEVEPGQRVLELDNSQFTRDLEQNRLAEAAALNELMRREADLDVELGDKGFAVERSRIELEKARLAANLPAEIMAERDWQERQLAFERARVAHEKAVEDLDAGLRAADAAIRELRVQLDKARADVAAAERAIEDLIVRAPSAGILVVAENREEGRKFQVGDNVWVGLTVMTIPDLSRMKVEARLSDVDDGKIEPGMAARCTLDTWPDRVYAGRVSEIAPIAAEQGRESRRRAFRVTILLDESDPERMRPGMSVRAEVLGEPVAGAILAPREAIDTGGETPTARMSDGSRRAITLGPCVARECVVERGLAEGERLRGRG